MTADGADGDQAPCVRREARLRRTRPLDEEPDRAVPQQRLRLRRVIGRHVEGRHLVDALALHPQRLATGGQQTGFRAGARQRLGHSRRRVDDVLAVVEHEEQPPSAERPRDPLGRRLGPAELQPGRRGDDGGDECRVRQWRQIGEPGAIGAARQQAPCHLQAEPRLAHPAGADQGDGTVRPEQTGHLVELGLAADQLRSRCREVAPGERRRGGGAAVSSPLAAVVRMPLGDEPVAAAGDGPDQPTIAAQRLAQGRDVHLKGVLLDYRTRPDAAHDLVLGHELALRLDQQLEDVEGAAADGDRHAIHD